MSDLGIKGLVEKSVTEVNNLTDLFIKSSFNVMEGIIKGDDADVCMLSLIRDTYMCNLILRYVGMMTLIDPEPAAWISIDNKMMTYINEYHSNARFRNKLIDLYGHYLERYEKDKTQYDYCRFLNKIVNRCDISKRGVEFKKTIRMSENRILNLLSVNPVIRIPTRYFREIPTQYEIKQDKVVVQLNYTNYQDLITRVEDIDIRHQIERQYVSRTNNVLSDFSKLVVARDLLAKDSNHLTYFEYINRGKHDNTETIKEFIIELNNKINNKTMDELTRIHNYYSRSTKVEFKIQQCDVDKYVGIHGNSTKFEPKQVFYVIFTILDRYFGLKLVRSDEKAWKQTVVVYNVIDKTTNKLLGRLFMDILFDENKKISAPISIRLSDKMQVNVDSRSVSEIALLTNYTATNCMTYKDVVLLFREFGYIINNLCYESRVGLINYDEEFSNYLPSLMECIAWDRDTIRMVVGSLDHTVIDHIEHTRDLDFCYNLKIKCINAKFDHLIHNSQPLMDIITKDIENKIDSSKKLGEIYRDIYSEFMNPVSHICETNIDDIHPNVVIQEMNGTQGLLYSNLMNEIFAYATFWIMKEKTKTGAGFRETVLNNGVDNYRDLIRNYLKKLDIDCFALYIKNVIKTDVLEDYVTEDTNYFEEIGSESDDDQEEIIQIRRTRN